MSNYFLYLLFLLYVKVYIYLVEKSNKACYHMFYINNIKEIMNFSQSKVGIFGLTANPVHVGHRKVVLEALNSLDEVWVTLVFNHPWGKKPVEYFHRLKMCEIMFEDLPNVKIMELDREYYEETNKIPYSYNILTMARDKYNIDPVLLIGQDNFKEEVWKKFYKNQEIEKEFGVFVAKDSGVHSTDIRKLVKNKQWEIISPHVGEKVLKYIQENNLYILE